MTRRPNARRAVLAENRASPVRATRDRSQLSRMALILAAERLVAQNGFGAVTMAAITEAAKASNASAIHYHFGSIDALFRSILEYRFGAANGVRTGMLADIDRTDLRALVGAMVLPLVQGLEPRPEGNWYLRFLLRVYEAHNVELLSPPGSATGWRKVQEMIRKVIGRALPPALADLRIELARAQLISGLAELEAHLDEKQAMPLPVLIEAIIDSIVAVLAAPMSSATQEALGRATAERRPFPD